ncbi:carbohydrate ABC transporter permease [Acidisoma silvae]|uniref:Sugar ABC transporter permease n=1 Tax=Acidisoma silvae TaxID=2802396 RepID=A0A963YSN3_9PROT|nr:sugar ABC transporter permease [Acidisoma silvae]MCB8875648.1 sugar ABC transporter permease [Acidisoma silvae]
MSATTASGGAPASPKPRQKKKGPGGGVNTLPLLAPSVILLLIWMIVPLAMTLFFAFRRYNLLNPMIHGWAGFRNFEFLLKDPALLHSLVVSVIIVVGVIVITICLGTVLAAIFNQPFRGQGVARVLMISPFFVMPTVSALVWKNLLLDPVSGLFAAMFRMVGLQPVAWFSVFPLGSVMTILCWEWLPYAFLILFTALQSMDEEQLEAARLDGASALDIFFNIQLPHMSRAISVTIMIEMIFLLSVFAEIYVTTGGGPGYATTNLTFLIYQRALLAFNVGGASAAGVIAIILANIVSAFLTRSVAKRLEV